MNTKIQSAQLNDAQGLNLDFSHLWHLLLGKSWVIILFFVLSLGVAIAYLLRTPKIYESRAVIQVEQEAPKIVKIQEINPEDYTLPEALKTVEQALMSDTLLVRVVKSSGLEKDPSFAPPRADGALYLDSELAQRFKRKLSVGLRRGTRLIDIVIQDTDPKRAQQLAQSMVDEFVAQSFEQQTSVAKAANDSLLQEAERLKEKLHNSEQALQQYREEHHAVSLEDKQNIIVEKLKELNLKVIEAKGARLKLESDLGTIQQGRAKTPEKLLQLASVTALPEVADLRKQIALKEGEFKAPGPIGGLKETLNRTLLNAGALLMKSYEAAKTTEAKLTAALKEQEEAALELDGIAIPYHALLRDVETDRVLYESVLSRMKETGVTKSLGENSIRLIESPLVAARPVKPAKLRILELAALAGFIVGIGMVIGIDMTDSSIHSIDHAEKLLGLPVLTSVPESKRKDLVKESALIADPASHEAEAFRSLRTALSLIGQDKGTKTILFTSANPAEGKSYCAFNHAVSLAQLGFRTLLVDADLRRQNLSKLVLSGRKVPGLTACLTRRLAIVDCCKSNGVENLFILGTGQRVAKPAELLASSDFARLLEDALRHFDRIVLDSAPINPVSDTRLIAKSIQSVCLVVRAGKTPRRAIVRACSLLGQATHDPEGIVLNRMARKSPDNYYFSEYGQEYREAGVNAS